MRFLAYLQGAAALAMLAALAIGGVLIWRYFASKGILGAAQDLKEKTPFGAPARGIDAVISWGTNREETLGGWLADLTNPSARKVNGLYGRTAENDYLGFGEIPLPSVNPRDRN